jgi:hypothetical protein
MLGHVWPAALTDNSNSNPWVAILFLPMSNVLFQPSLQLAGASVSMSLHALLKEYFLAFNHRLLATSARILLS